MFQMTKTVKGKTTDYYFLDKCVEKETTDGKETTKVIYPEMTFHSPITKAFAETLLKKGYTLVRIAKVQG